MKKLKTLLIAALAGLTLSFNSYAGLLISSGQSEYSVGDTLSIDLFYQTNDGSPAANVLDIWFDSNLWFDYSNDVASFVDSNLPSTYNNADPFAFVSEYAVDEAEYFLSTFGTEGPFDATDTFSLGTLNFQTTQAGVFNFNLIDFGLYDFWGYFDDTAPASYSVNVVAAEVPEPSGLAVLGFVGLMLFRLKRRNC
ncbi:hypothetical protein DS2_06701 [Catenovulum agarivorans DS-2]|uniref:PEP-CTERM protein-sorting domain-containing protein n=1 Tax=Catenovulum agarivorans DS-2 TaxID=1328313 RepID=W7QCV1_9ALTE|nr:PEP-CTERM sorting domain-containing protein [Catenovulum agarivorans]EWH10719.1 hypothetical protein DS2_06701 [Catenovulum agarivorans DS-2]